MPMIVFTPNITLVDGFLTSQFGLRPSPFNGRPEFHRGVDIAAFEGTPIHAVLSGRVVFAGSLDGYGDAVIIQHTAQFTTLVGHLSKISQTTFIGALVKAGDVVGLTGSTGLSQGPHVHIEFRLDGKPVCPLCTCPENAAQFFARHRAEQKPKKHNKGRP